MGATKTVSGSPPDEGGHTMDINILALVISVLTLLFTAVGTYIAYMEYIVRKRSKPKAEKCKHSKSNRHVLAKLSVAFTIKVTKN